MSPNEIILGPFTGLPPSPNKTGGAHWSKLYKVKQEWQELVGYAGLAYKSKNRHQPLKRAAIHYQISVGDNRPHDPDNLSWAVTKPTLDGLKGIIIEDDSIDNVSLSYSFDRLKPRGFTITITPKE